MSINKIIKKFISRFNFFVYKKINNSRFKIPLLNSVGTLNIRENEKWMVQLLTTLVNMDANTIFIDVGANIGQTLLKIKSVDISIPYYGFEPNPVCNYYLTSLIKVNQLKNCNIFPIGLGADIEIKNLFIFGKDDISSASGSTIPDLFELPPLHTEHIAVFTLDYFNDKFFVGKKVNILKIDVENAELEVLKGALKTIDTFKPFIITEILPIVNKNTISKTNARKAEMQKIMKNINYQFYKIVIDKHDSFIGLKTIDDIAADTAALSSIQYDFNYLIAPVVKIGLIEKFIL